MRRTRFRIPPHSCSILPTLPQCGGLSLHLLLGLLELLVHLVKHLGAATLPSGRFTPCMVGVRCLRRGAELEKHGGLCLFKISSHLADGLVARHLPQFANILCLPEPLPSLSASMQPGYLFPPHQLNKGSSTLRKSRITYCSPSSWRVTLVPNPCRKLSGLPLVATTTQCVPLRSWNAEASLAFFSRFFS